MLRALRLPLSPPGRWVGPDYLKLREEPFADETVESLYAAASQPGH